MDLVTNAILLGVAAGITSEATKATQSAITYAFNKIKSLLNEKPEKNRKVIKAILEVEENPNSTGRKEVLREEVSAASLEADPEVFAAAKELIELAKKSPDGQEIINQTVFGDKNIFSGSGDIHISNK